MYCIPSISESAMSLSLLPGQDPNKHYILRFGGWPAASVVALLCIGPLGVVFRPLWGGVLYTPPQKRTSAHLHA